MGKALIIPKDKHKIFLPYQQRWVDDRSRLKLMEKGRQIGLSWSTAFGCVERTAPKEARNDQWVSSRDDIQARLFLEDCKRFAGLLDAAANDLGLVVIDPDKGISAYVLHFGNGKRIHSMSSNPDAQAGKRGGRVLDEFALHPDPRKLYSIAYPGITWGGQLELVSTHRGSDNFFNELAEDIKHRGNPKGFSLHTVTLQNALEQGFLYKLQNALPKDDERQEMDEAEYFDFIRAGCASEEQFLQEYMCVPADDAGAFLSYDLIAGCEYRATADWQLNEATKNRELYLGMDVGRVNDLTVFWLIERVSGMMFTRRVVTLQNKTFSEQESVLYELLQLPGLRRACLDATGLGMQLAERAQEKFGTYLVEAVTFTSSSKEAMAYPLRTAFEDKSIRIPKDDEIRADLRSIKKVVSAAGNIRFAADRGPGGHADRFWALALSVEAASSPGVKYAYESVKKRESKDDDDFRTVKATAGFGAISGAW